MGTNNKERKQLKITNTVFLMCNCFNHVNNKRSLKNHALFSLTNIRRIFCVTILKRFKFFLKWRNAKKDDFPSRYSHPRRQIRIQNITFICNYIFSKNVFQKSLRIIKWNVNSDLIKKVYTHFRRLIPSCAIHFLIISRIDKTKVNISLI